MAHCKRIPFTIGQAAVELDSDRIAVAGTIKFLGVQTAKHPVNALAKALTEFDIDDLKRVRVMYQKIRAGRDTRVAEAESVAAPAPPRRKRRCRSTRGRG
jgi:hypothetical protein